MLRHEPAAADAKFGVALGGEHAFDQFHARPDAAGILPAAARTAEPFAEDGARQHEPAFVFLERTMQRTGLAGCSHAQRNHGGQQARGDGQPRAFGNTVDGADEFEPPALPHHPRQQVGEALARAFHAGWNDAAGDDRRLEQAEVIFGEIEHVGQVRDVGGGAEVHARQAQHRFIQHAQVGFHRRPRDGIASMHAEVNRDVQHLRALGIIHAEKENVAPAAMRQVHAHRGAFAQDRVGAVLVAALQQLGPDAQRMIGGMAHAEHPLIAAHRAHAAADLVRQRLQGQPLIGHGQRAGNRVGRPIRRLRLEKSGDGLFKSALQQLRVAGKRNQGPGVDIRLQRQMKPVDGIKKQQGANPFVKIFTAMTERLEFGAFDQQLRHRCGAANGVERLVAHRRVRRGDELNEFAGHALKIFTL